MENTKNHSLTIEYGQGLIASLVSDVLSFNEREITVALSGATRLKIWGEKLKIGGYNKQSGELRVTGSVSCVRYQTSPAGQLKRIFK